MNRIKGVLAVSVVLLSACSTELKSVRVMNGEPLKTGALYNLSFTQYKLVVSRRLACTEQKGVNGSRQLLSVDYAVDATASELPDPLRYYSLDFKSLQGFFKTTDVSVAYHPNGAVKSINASAEDKTGEFIGSVAKNVTKLAAAGAAFLTVDPPANTPRCSAELVARLAQVDALEQSIKDATKRTEALTKRLADQTAVGTTLGRGWDDASRKTVALTMVALQQELNKLDDYKVSLKGLLKTLSFTTQPILWPQNGEVFSSGTMAPIPALSSQQILELVNWHVPANRQLTQASYDYDSLAQSTGVYFQISPLSTVARQAPTPPANFKAAVADDQPEGFKYRIPADGQLDLCTDPYCAIKVASADPGKFSQLGYVYTIPLESAFLSNKTIAATFSEQGMVQTLGVKSSASSDKAASLLGDVTDLATTVHKTKSEQQLTDLQAKTKLLTAQKDYNDALKALAPAGDTSVADRTAQFKSDTALMEAEVANINARKTLDDARRAAGG